VIPLKIGLTQELSKTLIPLRALRPLRFVSSCFCESPEKDENQFLPISSAINLEWELPIAILSTAAMLFSVV
jgi:hypothetical protein